MTCGQRRNADNVYVILNSLLGSLGRGLEQGTHIDIEADIGITRSYDLGTAVVTILTQLCNHDTGLATLLLGKLGAHLLGALERLVVFHC